MTSNKHVELIRQGVAAWNGWRANNADHVPDLVGAGLRGLDLTSANLDGADLREADLRGTILRETQLAGADLSAANLFKAVLDGANLDGANLIRARFLECAQLTAARNWQSAFRDEALACGAQIPERRNQS
jgi:uncharacterized protein YjbI with pentapeptide repeats